MSPPLATSAFSMSTSGTGAPSPNEPAYATSARMSSSLNCTGPRLACMNGSAIGMRPVRSTKSTAAGPSVTKGGPRSAMPSPLTP